MRIQAVVNAGAYPSTQAAIDAAVTAVEIAAESGFEGSQDELEGLLMKSLESRELTERKFWESVEQETTDSTHAKDRGQSGLSQRLPPPDHRVFL